MKEYIKGLERERDALHAHVCKLIGLNNKIVDYLDEEVTTNSKSTFDDYDSEVVDDEDVYLCRGRAELAQGLINQITKWENEDA